MTMMKVFCALDDVAPTGAQYWLANVSVTQCPGGKKVKTQVQFIGLIAESATAAAEAAYGRAQAFFGAGNYAYGTAKPISQLEALSGDIEA